MKCDCCKQYITEAYRVDLRVELLTMGTDEEYRHRTFTACDDCLKGLEQKIYKVRCYGGRERKSSK